MKLNQKTLRQLRRALRGEATGLVKFRREIHNLQDHWRWKTWHRGSVDAVRQLLAAAEVLDDPIGAGGDTEYFRGKMVCRHGRKRRKRLHVVKPVRPQIDTDRVPANHGAVQ
jgi:hypothetical protein